MEAPPTMPASKDNTSPCTVCDRAAGGGEVVDVGAGVGGGDEDCGPSESEPQAVSRASASRIVALVGAVPGFMVIPPDRIGDVTGTTLSTTALARNHAAAICSSNVSLLEAL